MLHWLEKRASLTPDRIAIYADGRSISYAQLRTSAKLAAERLANMGATRKAHIALLCNNGAHVPKLIHAIHYLGAVVVPLNTRLTAHELAYQLNDANCVMLIYDDELSALAQASAKQVPTLPIYKTSDILDPKESAFANEESASVIEKNVDDHIHSAIQTYIHNEDTHSIIYTSGTTGRPKGVVLSFANYWASAIDSAVNLGLNDDDHWLACLPLFHVGGMSILVRSVIYGIPVTIHKKFDPIAVNHTINESRITIISVVSAMLNRMIENMEDQVNHKISLQHEQHSLYPEHLRCVLLGGGPAPLPLLEASRKHTIPVYQTYGLTETASQIATLSPDYTFEKIGSAGKPLFQSELKIIADGQQALPGETGDIYVRGPSVTKGYWKNDQNSIGSNIDQTSDHKNTEKTFNPHSLKNTSDSASDNDDWLATKDLEHASGDANNDNWLATGDLGYVDEDGFLYVLDRRSDLIISGGENVYPAEIESVLLSHPDVAEAGVTGIDDPRWGQVPIAYVVLKEGTTFSEQALIDYCSERLARYKIPAAIHRTTHLPRNAANKLLRRELKGWV